MKKILAIIGLFLATTMTTFSQTTDTTSCCSKKTPITGYVSYGLSMTNSSDFATSSYTGIEGGIMKGNLGLGVVFGRGSLAGLGKSGDNIRNYFYEAKMTGSFPMGNVNGTVLLGYGGYIDTKHQFIEYGVGISYTVGKFAYGATYSNWDGVNYITPGVTFNF